jgi:hypothetical protein
MTALKYPVALILCVVFMGTAMAVEEPKFERLSQDGAYELRRYPAFIVAETFVTGDMDEASGRGFRAIADYIFGNNQVMLPTDGEASAKIAMTAPVTLEPVAQAQKIAMTAPVTLEPQTQVAGTPAALQGAKQWRVHFVMPSQYTMATLPQPKNNAVKLREVPSKQWAVLSYSGFNSEAAVQRHTDELLAWVANRQLTPVGNPQLARYDPPWTLPMFRRNEILVEIGQP